MIIKMLNLMFKNCSIEIFEELYNYPMQNPRKTVHNYLYYII